MIFFKIRNNNMNITAIACTIISRYGTGTAIGIAAAFHKKYNPGHYTNNVLQEYTSSLCNTIRSTSTMYIFIFYPSLYILKNYISNPIKKSIYNTLDQISNIQGFLLAFTFSFYCTDKLLNINFNNDVNDSNIIAR